jgi:uncharacterized protein (DUF1684 family)
MMRRSIAVLILLAAACQQESVQPAAPATPAEKALNFDVENAKWRETRRTRLTSDTGWLTLVGLEWLHDGVNEITLPTNPPSPKKFTLEKGKVSMEGAPLRDDTDPAGPTVTNMGTLSFQVIKRADKGADRFGIRMRDTGSEARKDFKGLDYYAADPAYRVEARFEPYQPAKKVTITNVLGMTSEETAPGALVFTLKGQEYRLEPILEQGETDLFIIFKDATSGKETYPAARYLYASPADANGKTFVDFNRAYNPPCAFTPYATCPLPPAQNKLPIAIEAGEKKYAGTADHS